MGREEEHYAWLAKVAKLKWRVDEDEEEDRPGGMAAMVVVESIGGVLDRPSRNAANDIAAQLALLLLVLLLVCANSRVKLREGGALLRKIRGAAICRTVTAEPMRLLASLVLAALMAWCQNDHLPTTPA